MFFLFKCFDLLYQAIPIIWLLKRYFSGLLVGQGNIAFAVLPVFVLPYQVITSYFLIKYKGLKNGIIDTALIRQVLCYLTIGSFLLSFVGSINVFLSEVMTILLFPALFFLLTIIERLDDLMNL